MSGTLSVEALVDREPLGALRWRVLAIATAVMMLDGYDIAAMGYVVPALARAWDLPPSAFGWALSAAIAGVAIGSLTGGPIGDRLGRRRAIIGFFAFGGVAALATTLADSLPQLIAARAATGVGMGAVIPNVIALVSEYMPRRRRAFFTVCVYSGAGFGSVVGSLVAAALVPRVGWQVVFLVGGAGPLALATVAAAGLPESLHVLLRRGDRARSLAVARAIDARLNADDALDVPAIPAESHALAAVRTLFAGARARATLLLWTLFVGTQALVFFFASWLTTVLTQTGLPLRQALYALSLFNLGSLLGGWVVAWQSDRRSPELLLAAAYSLGAVAITALAWSELPWQMYVASASAGAAIVGASYCLGAVAASYYPPSARATGVGWGLAVGRTGSITSPLLGAAALGAGWSTTLLVGVAAIPALVCALAALALRAVRERALAEG